MCFGTHLCVLKKRSTTSAPAAPLGGWRRGRRQRGGGGDTPSASAVIPPDNNATDADAAWGGHGAGAGLDDDAYRWMLELEDDHTRTLPRRTTTTQPPLTTLPDDF